MKSFFCNKNEKRNNKGFTLVELVIVVAILAILVGLLAPQYTKYVEKSRKAADASNMDEMVKVVKIYAADPANELPVGEYTITINTESNDGTKVSTAVLTGSAQGATAPDAKAVEDALTAAIPKWASTVTKSKKWKDDGSKSAISAKISVLQDGGTKVEYRLGSTYTAGNAFEKYMTGSEQ